MGALYEYRSWLTKLERQPSFLNNYWCVMLANDMEENKSSEGFQIPYFIVEKELMREDNNVHLKSTDEIYKSPALRHWLIHLLKAHNETTNINNYEAILREVLEKKIPLSVAKPLHPSSSFHCLPSECKLWILHMLWSRSKPGKPVRSIATDTLGNSYYLVSCCRLYVSMATMDVTSLPIDESRLICEPWGPFYRFVYNQPCRLLCENQEGWSAVLKMLQFYNLTNLCYTLIPEMTAKLTEQHLIMSAREEQRRAFDASLSKLTSNVEPGAVGQLGKKQMKKLKKEAAALEDKADVKSLGADMNAMKVKETSAATAPSEVKQVTDQPKEKISKCWSFPQCPYKNTCQYTHPKLPCTKFPNCKSGWKCLFLHPFCPNDAHCKDVNCAYEHVHSQPTFYRAKRDTEAENVRPVASVPPTVRKVSSQMAKKDNEKAAKAPATAPANNQPGEKRRCLYYPKWCKKGDACEYFHPHKMCKRQAEGKKCAGQRCLYLHGPCKKDGNCTDLKCIFDHYKSTPVIERKLALEKQGGLTRTTSMSSLSTVHILERRKSVSSDFDSDSDSIDSSAEKKPAGILKNPAVAAKERCHFGARCTKIRCDYTHPKEKCPAFPKCPNGGACIFLHEVCKNDGVCTKDDCDYEHYLAHTVRNRWCNKGSRCHRVDCTYLHPKTCVVKCPSPGNCWMRHVRSSSAKEEGKTKKAPKQDKKGESKTDSASKGAQPNPKRERQSKGEPTKKPESKPPKDPKKKASAAPNPAKATPVSPQVTLQSAGHPPTGLPPLIRYGFGPDSSFRPAPGFPGYGPGPVPLFAPGYGGYGPGGYYPPPGNAAPPVMFPPPPPPYISREDREMLDRKDRPPS